MTLPRGPEPHEWDRHMSAEEAMARMVQRTGIAVTHLNRAIVEAAKEWRACGTVEAQDAAAMRLADAVDRLPIDLVPAEPLASVALLANRRDEVLRREANILADYEAGVEAKVAAFESSSQAGLASLRDPWPHSSPCPEQCEACGCCIHSTLACSAREDVKEGSLCGGAGCGCEGRS